MLVGPSGEGLIVGQDKGGGICKHLRGHMPVDASLCVTGLRAADKPHVEPVHVFSEANARLIAAAPDLLAENARLREQASMLRDRLIGLDIYIYGRLTEYPDSETEQKVNEAITATAALSKEVQP